MSVYEVYTPHYAPERFEARCVLIEAGHLILLGDDEAMVASWAPGHWSLFRLVEDEP